jgi:hypothetical protein
MCCRAAVPYYLFFCLTIRSPDQATPCGGVIQNLQRPVPDSKIDVMVRAMLARRFSNSWEVESALLLHGYSSYNHRDRAGTATAIFTHDDTIPPEDSEVSVVWLTFWTNSSRISADPT